MPEYQRYVTRVETKVVVSVALLSGGELPVGEFTVRSETGGDSSSSGSVPAMVRVAMEKNAKQASIMAAGVDNTERNRLK